MNKEKFSKTYDKYYKKILIIPIILILLSLGYMGYFYSQTGDFIYKDISLTGGTTVTINDQIDSQKIKQDLDDKLEDLSTREIYDLITKQQKAVIIETTTDSETTQEVLEEYLDYELTSENSSVEFTGSSLSKSFYKELILAMIIAFIFMAIVVFIIFRTLVPSTAVLIAAFADLLMTLVTVNLLEIKLSTAGIVAFLMLIGYSVDTDILLTTRVLKRQGEINTKLYSAFKTGITMALTSLVVAGIALYIIKPSSEILGQIFTILFIGLSFDIFNTWITNASIIKWYAHKKK